MAKVNPRLRRWWQEDARAWETMIGAADAILREDEPRFAQYLRNASLYGGRKFANLIGLSAKLPPAIDDADVIKLNVVASCVDTAVAKLIKNRPAPQFVTNGADWKVRRKAEVLNKFGKGVLHSSGFYEGAARGLREAAIFGTSFTKMVDDDGDVCAEPVYPWEILVERTEAERMRPRTMIQRTWVDREVLRAAYDQEGGRGVKERLAAIDTSKSPPVSAAISLGREREVDQIEVFEGWRLPSKKGAKDGRHIIAVRGGELSSEPWERDEFPFATLRWEDPVAGFWGVGIPERLTGIQFEINELLQKIQTAFHLLGVPRVFLDMASGVPKAHINNEIGAIISINGGAAPPTVVAPQTIHPEVFAHLQWLYQRAFDEVGISQLAAQSRKPAGLDSGAALREFSDIESERFMVQGRKIEDWHLEAVERAMDVADEIEGFSVDVVDKRFRDTLKWKDVKVGRDQYTLQCFPVSLLPQTPAGRLEKVQELIAGQFVTREQGLEMLDVPDLEEGMREALAPRRHVRRVVDKILDGKGWEQPDPRMNLDGANAYVLGVYNEACADGCPEDVLNDLRDYMDQLQGLIDTRDAAAAAPSPTNAAAMAAAPTPQPMTAMPVAAAA